MLRFILSCSLCCTLLLTGCQWLPKIGPQDPLDAALEALDEDINAYRLTTPKGENALEKLQQLEGQYPNEPRLQEYRTEIARAYLRLAKQRLERQDLEGARQFLFQAEALVPNLPGSAELKQQLQPKTSVEVKPQMPVMPLTPQQPHRQMMIDPLALSERDEQVRQQLNRFIAQQPKNIARIEIKAPDFYQRRWLEILLQNALTNHQSVPPVLRSAEDQQPRLELYLQSSTLHRYQF